MKNPVGLDLSRTTPIIFFLLKSISSRLYFSHAKIFSKTMFFYRCKKDPQDNIFPIYTGRFFGLVYREENLPRGKPIWGYAEIIAAVMQIN